MCNRCHELDVQIARYERLRSQVTDNRLIDGIVDMLKGYAAEKAALHPVAA
jgi:hypothetical protein